MTKSLYEKLKDHAKKNPDGFTIKIINGKIRSFNPSKKNRYVISKTNYDTHLKQKLGFKDFKHGLVGGWFDKKTGKYYIDKNVAVGSRSKAIKLGIKHQQKAIFDLLKMKEIRITLTKKKITRVVTKRKGKWYNTITNRYVSKSTAKRYNSYFKRNPKGTIHEAWGGTKYKKYRIDPETGKKEIFPVSEQKKLIRNLWYKQDQFVKKKDKSGKDVLYSPFSDTFLTVNEKKIIKKLDYTFLNGKVEVHLHRLSKDDNSVFHIITYHANSVIKTELDFDRFMNFIYGKFIPRLRTELFKIKKYHTLSIDNIIFGQMDVHFYTSGDYVSTGKTFGGLTAHYRFNKQGIDITLNEMIEAFDYFMDYFLKSSYLTIIFDRITIYIKAWSTEENVKYARYRYGIKGLKNGNL